MLLTSLPIAPQWCIFSSALFKVTLILFWYFFMTECWAEDTEDGWRCLAWRKCQSAAAGPGPTAVRWGALMLSWALQRKALTHPCCRQWAMAMNVFINLLRVDSCLPGGWEEILLQIAQVLQQQHFAVFWSGLSLILSQRHTSQCSL